MNVSLRSQSMKTVNNNEVTLPRKMANDGEKGVMSIAITILHNANGANEDICGYTTSLDCEENSESITD